MSADTSKIARIRETADGFVIYDYDGNRASYAVLVSDADAGEWARDMGFEEIIWEDVQPTTPEATTPTPAEVEYRNLYKEIDDLMAEAGQLIDEHALGILEDAAGNPPTWEHVGDMKHARQLIKQLVAFLSPDGE